MDSFLFEEIMKFKNIKNDDEIAKYYIDHKLSDKDVISFILKRGLYCQKNCLFMNFRFYTYSRDIFQYFLDCVIDFESSMDEGIHMVFSNSLLKFFKDEENKIAIRRFDEDIFNRLIEFLIRLITSLGKGESEEYTKALFELVQILSTNKIRLSNRNIEYVLNFGKSGKNNIEKRFCVFFCSLLIQIDKENNSDLIGKFIEMHTDKEKVVKREVAYQLRFVAKVCSQDFFNKHLFDIIKKFLEDTELAVQVETIISLLENYEKAYDDDAFNKKLIETIIIIIGNAKLDSKDIIKKITKMVKAIMEISMKKIKVAQILEKDVMAIFNKFIFTNQRKVDINFAFYLIEEFYLYASYLGNFNETNKLMSLTEILMKIVFDPSFVDIPSGYKNEVGERPKHKDLKFCFLDNIENIFKHLPKPIVNKYVIEGYFKFFDDASNNQDLILHWYKTMNKVVMICERIQNKEFFLLMQKYFKDICSWFMHLDNLDWRTKKEVLITFRSAELLYKGDQFVEKAFHIVVKNLKEEQNFKIQEECAKQIIFLLKQGNKQVREDVGSLCNEYANSTNYYDRRLFIPMFEEALSLFSISFLKKSMFLSYFLNLLDNDHPLILNRLIKLLPQVYPLISSDRKIKMQINSELSDIKEKVKDLETVYQLSLFDKWLDMFEKNPNSSEFTNILSIDSQRQKIEESESFTMKCFDKFNPDSMFGSLTAQPGPQNKSNTSVNLINVGQMGTTKLYSGKKLFELTKENSGGGSTANVQRNAGAKKTVSSLQTSQTLRAMDIKDITPTSTTASASKKTLTIVETNKQPIRTLKTTKVTTNISAELKKK